MEIDMKMSDTIAELATALSKAQGAIDDATKTGLNPMFKSRYADLAAVRSVIREPLAVNDLVVMQFPRTSDNHVEVETMILHKSGEFMSETLRLPVNKWDAQGIGSAITYGRRYGLMSMLSIASEDDDGNAAVQRPVVNEAAQARQSEAQNKLRERILDSLRAAAKEGSEALREKWASLAPEHRSWMGGDVLKELKAEGVKADAAKVEAA
jgi:hypothetical protein